MSLPDLQEKYKKYFGLILSRLYASPVLPTTSPPLRPKPSSNLLKNVLREQKLIPRANRLLNLYNSGAKLSELLMKVNRGDSISTEWLTIYPNCGRELKFE
jgi:hypothetical protein